jgi:2-C-methyl-D-erythritol 4-phosphate cytidylyltransferase
MRYWLAMPAAGSGSRFGAHLPKQYAALEGRTVIEWALTPFRADPRCAGAVLALAPGDRHWPEIALRLPAGPAVQIAPGGEQRSLSVRNALTALKSAAAADDWVLVHDAARPCLESADLERLTTQLAQHPLGGLLATPAADTLKRAQPAAGGAAAEVAQTVERASLWRALTPQMFRYGALCAALDAAHGAGRFPTDEAQALEWTGAHPRLVPGSPSNLKITTAAELSLAAGILRARHP